MSKIHGFKGYNKNLQCRGFQYEVGKTYEHEGEAVTCESGFHFCEYPLDVFRYYPPADSRYTEVVGEGCADNGGQGDTKVCASKLTIGAEIGISGIVKASVEYIKERVDKSEEKEETGYQSAATNTGNRSAANVSGKESVAVSLGIEAVAKGALGCYLVLGEWKKDENNNWHLIDVKSFKVDGGVIKSDTYYKLVNGEPIEMEWNA